MDKFDKFIQCFIKWRYITRYNKNLNLIFKRIHYFDPTKLFPDLYQAKFLDNLASFPCKYNKW